MTSTSKSQAPDGENFTQILQIHLPPMRITGFRQKGEPRLSSDCHEEGEIIISPVEAWLGLPLLMELSLSIWDPKVRNSRSQLNVRVAL